LHEGRGLINPRARATAYNLEEHRAALTGHCYRMLGSAAEANDAVQESWCCARASASRSWPRSSTSLPGSAGLLHQDATLSMPPFSLWLRGHEPISQWLLGRGSGCRGSRLVPTSACGSPAFGQYRPPAEPGGPHKAWALIVLELSGDRIAALNSFLDTEALFPRFGLPSELAP